MSGQIILHCTIRYTTTHLFTNIKVWWHEHDYELRLRFNTLGHLAVSWSLQNLIQIRTTICCTYLYKVFAFYFLYFKVWNHNYNWLTNGNGQWLLLLLNVAQAKSKSNRNRNRDFMLKIESNLKSWNCTGLVVTILDFIVLLYQRYKCWVLKLRKHWFVAMF